MNHTSSLNQGCKAYLEGFGESGSNLATSIQPHLHLNTCSQQSDLRDWSSNLLCFVAD